MRLRCLRGTAEAVRHSTHHHAGAVAAFTIDAQPIQVATAVPALIADGDAVVVCGYDRGGVLYALAYANASTGRTWGAAAASLASAAALLVMAAAVVWFAFDLPGKLASRHSGYTRPLERLELALLLAALLLAVVALRLLYVTRRAREAYRMVGSPRHVDAGRRPGSAAAE